MKRTKAVPIPLDTEVRDDPDHETKEVDDCTDVMEDAAKALTPEIDDSKACKLG